MSNKKRKTRRAKLSERLRRKYHINLTDYEAWVKAQDGKCAICGDAPVEGTRLDVDHRHSDGFLRGLLCRGCNLGIGHFKEDVARLAKAIEYLVKRS